LENVIIPGTFILIVAFDWSVWLTTSPIEELKAKALELLE